MLEKNPKKNLRVEYNLPKTEGDDQILSAIHTNHVDFDSIQSIQDDYTVNKKRKTRINHSVVHEILEPTTMRGVILKDVVRNQKPRGFYVTKSDAPGFSTTEMTGMSTEIPEMSSVEFTSTEATTADTVFPGTIAVDQNNEIVTDESVSMHTAGEILSTVQDATDTSFVSDSMTATESMSKETIANDFKVTKQSENSTAGVSTTEMSNTEMNTPDNEMNTPEMSTPEVNTPIMSTPEISTPGMNTPIMSNPKMSMLEMKTPEMSIPELSTPEMSIPEMNTPEMSTPETNTPELGTTMTPFDTTIDFTSPESTTGALPEAPSLIKDQESKYNKTAVSIKDASITSLRKDNGISSTTSISSTEKAADKEAERVQNIRRNNFGRKVSRRPSTRYNSELNERRSFERVHERNQYPRRRIPSYRGRHRYYSTAPTTIDSSILKDSKEESQRLDIPDTNATLGMERTIVKETTEVSAGAEIEQEANSAKKEKKLVEMIMNYDGEVDDTGKAEVLTKEEANHRSAMEDKTDNPEVISSQTSRVTTRTHGTLLSTRLRKISSTSAPQRESNPQSRKADSKTSVDKGVGQTTEGSTWSKNVDEKTETSDQSSRAQEIAVTLTDPPTSQSPITGRLPLRDTLRRKISTTVSPRTDTTTSRTTAKFITTVRSRQRQRTKEKPVENVSTRPRRPPVVDYDYYEDEVEPVVAKSSFNGKLFLTSRGTIRCLDQGNFPHPYSCKKFITCARMVNGLVVGAEYTCPAKLSFDPIGGICNWSAGLGCKE